MYAMTKSVMQTIIASQNAVIKTKASFIDSIIVLMTRACA